MDHNHSHESQSLHEDAKQNQEAKSVMSRSTSTKLLSSAMALLTSLLPASICLYSAIMCCLPVLATRPSSSSIFAAE